MFRKKAGLTERLEALDQAAQIGAPYLSPGNREGLERVAKASAERRALSGDHTVDLSGPDPVVSAAQVDVPLSLVLADQHQLHPRRAGGPQSEVGTVAAQPGAETGRVRRGWQDRRSGAHIAR